jgi:hypothetical protein
MQSQKDFPSELEHEAKEADLSTNQSLRNSNQSGPPQLKEQVFTKQGLD